MCPLNNYLVLHTSFGIAALFEVVKLEQKTMFSFAWGEELAFLHHWYLINMEHLQTGIKVEITALGWKSKSVGELDIHVPIGE